MIITVSGTPGVGKTYIAKKLAKASRNGFMTGLKYFDLNKYVKDKKLYDSYDRKAKTYDVDVNRLRNAVEPLFRMQHSRDIALDRLVNKTFKTESLLTILGEILAKHKLNGVILDSHLSHHLDSDYCIIVRTDIKEIYRRLKTRNYPRSKIQDNIESEIFDICLDEARAAKRKIIIVEN